MRCTGAFLRSEKALPSVASTFISTVVQSTNSSGVLRSNKLLQMAASCSLGTREEVLLDVLRTALTATTGGVPPPAAELLSGVLRKKTEYSFTSYQLRTTNS